ncbi:MAG: hypothetical protein AVDCRST_MAG73-4026, partial [uncultured Thermomicrobiales bacterium]
GRRMVADGGARGAGEGEPGRGAAGVWGVGGRCRALRRGGAAGGADRGRRAAVRDGRIGSTLAGGGAGARGI